VSGWFRHDPTRPTADRRVRFGTNVVSAANLRDLFVARYQADGREDYIRQGGSPDFDTVDNAHGYRIAVSPAGVVTTAGFTQVPPSGVVGIDFGDLRIVYPDLSTLGYKGGGSAPCLFVARLDDQASPAGPVAVAITLPTPGNSSLQVSWPAGFRLQYRTSLTGNDWQTLDVPSPFSVDAALLPEGYFRVVSP
jgi:hypothetical protein